MNIHIAIVAHKNRSEMAEKLATEVEANHVCLDNGTRGSGKNHRAAWEWHTAHREADWAVVLEDDAIPCKDFRSQLTAALEHAPTRVVSLYLGKGNPEGWQDTLSNAVVRADKAKACWIVDRHLMHAVGLAVDRRTIPMMTVAIDQCMVYATNGKGDFAADEAIGRYVYNNQIDVAYSVPSLVDHADGPPLIEHKSPRQPGRVAWKFGTRRKWDDSSIQLIVNVETARLGA
jgi:GR25 family glycosyltransferase involved in LPS biosynthesis